MTHHPRPPLFWTNTDYPAYRTLFGRSPGDATLEAALERGGTFGDKIGSTFPMFTAAWGAGKTAHVAEFARRKNAALWSSAAKIGGEIIAWDHQAFFAPPATVAGITGPGIEP